MPLVVPGVTTNSSDKTEEWTNKLVGKKISEEPSSSTVSDELPVAYCCYLKRTRKLTPHQTFCKTELPQPTRIIEPGMMVTKDFQPDRLNVHVKEDGTVSHVNHG